MSKALVVILAAFACVVVALNGVEAQAPGVGDLVLELAMGADIAAPEEYQFSLIRSILITPDRTIWVADMTPGAFSDFQRGTPSLRQYDAEGTFVRQVARAGDGPGEYRQPDGLAVLSDGRVAVRPEGHRDAFGLLENDFSAGTDQ